ncbi:MAG: hypothetical protein LAT57_11185 [Balneolales bacterium]|nr:hypothetical protein [Balneolales bacterium]
MIRTSNFTKVIQSFILIGIAYALIPLQAVHAQGEVSVGATTVTRYMWRGIQFDDGINFQPYMMYTISNFEAGVSSSMSLTNDFNEINFWVAYSVNTSFINAKFYVTDFYYQNPGSDFFNFKSERIHGVEGDHYGEAHIIFTSDHSPFELLFSTAFRNDPDNSLYTEVSYSKLMANDIGSTLSLGAALNKSARWYYTEKAGIINVSYELSKRVQITPEYALPVSVKSILNPTGKAFYVILAVSI